jgi:uncharacterized membrane protein
MSLLSEHSIGFDQPWFLLLLALAPLLWMFSFRSLAGLGFSRRLIVLTLRTLVFALLVGALAGFQMKKASNRLTVIYLVDLSLSIPQPQRAAMIEYVNAAIEKHRKDRDRVGVVVFGRDAAMEIPPFDENVRIPRNPETPFDPEFTNLEAAMKLAEASFPEDAAKRVVVVSDGIQNLGNALRQASSMAEKTISIDVVPIRYPLGGDVLVEKIMVPSDVRKGQPFELRVVINNTNQHPVSGRLRVERQTDNQPIVLNPEPDSQRVTLRPGKNPFTLRLNIDEPHFYKYQAIFVPDNKQDDIINENNKATTFTHVRGSGQVLVIEDHSHRGEFDVLVERLRKSNLEVTVRPSDNAFSSLAELQIFDTVILANLPRDDDNAAPRLTDDQVKMLVSNTQHMGAGLVMIGGDRSFGAGGWQDTELEKAMPLDFTIKNAKVVPKGALALVMHASEAANGNYWMKLVALEAIKALGSQDYCGMLHWNGNERWLWNHPQGLQPVGANRAKMLAAVSRMNPGDMPDFDSTMKMALTDFARVTDAASKHMVIISDGDPTPASNAVLNAFVKNKITVSTVEVSSHGGTVAEMQRIANATGGKYYRVLNNKSLPRIYQKEVRRIARPLIYNEKPFQPQIVRDHEIVRGIQGSLPITAGYVMTTPKENPLVEVLAFSPLPGDKDYPILAAWTYGLGRSVCFTTDAGHLWAGKWTSSEVYDKLFAQMVRWSMRPGGDEGNFSVVTELVDDKVRVIVTALDKDDNLQQGLNVAGLAVGPQADPREFMLKQVAPGRYIGEFEANDVGSYMVVLSPGKGKPMLRAGVNVPYSAEFRSRETDMPLLTQLAGVAPKAGKPGELIDLKASESAAEDPQQAMAEMLRVNSFRHDLPKANSSQDVWWWLVIIAVCAFFFDVFFRRVQFEWAWVAVPARKLYNRVLGRQEEAAPSEYLARLRSKKDEVSEEIEARKASARFEPQPDTPVADEDALSTALATPPQGVEPVPVKKHGMAPAEEEESYTDRLLKAKKKAQEEQKKKEKND